MYRILQIFDLQVLLTFELQKLKLDTPVHIHIINCSILHTKLNSAHEIVCERDLSQEDSSDVVD